MVRRLVGLRHDPCHARPRSGQPLERLCGEGELHVIAVVGDPAIHKAMAERLPARAHLLVVGDSAVEVDRVGPGEAPKLRRVVEPRHRHFGDPAHDGDGRGIVQKDAMHVRQHLEFRLVQPPRRAGIDRAPVFHRRDTGFRRAALVIGRDLRRRGAPRLLRRVNLERRQQRIRAALDQIGHCRTEPQRIRLVPPPPIRVQAVKRPHIRRRLEVHLAQHARGDGHPVAGLVVVPLKAHAVEAGFDDLLAGAKVADRGHWASPWFSLLERRSSLSIRATYSSTVSTDPSARQRAK